MHNANSPKDLSGSSSPGMLQLHKARITSIDALRGLVMIVMLLDHVRETLYLHLQVTDPMTPAGYRAGSVFFPAGGAFLRPDFRFSDRAFGLALCQPTPRPKP